MGALGDYFISLAAAAIICGLVRSMLTGNGAIPKLCKLVCGVVMTIIALQPFSEISLSQITEKWRIEQNLGENYAFDGKQLSRDAMAEIIKSQTEAYILDKAAQLDIQITAEVALDDAEIPAPASVVIKGTVAPYSKARLQQIIAQDLKIAVEDQHWKG